MKIMSDEFIRWMVEVGGRRPQEEAWAVYVDTQLVIRHVKCIAKGTLDAVVMHPRDVFRHAIAMNAYGFIIVHNHPSGRLVFSQMDLEVLGKLAVCAAIVQIHFFDFLVVSADGYLSAFEREMVPEIQWQNLLDLWTKHVNL